jgi:hypothetical protein
MRESDELNEAFQNLKKVIEQETRVKFEREREEHEEVNAIDLAYEERWNREHEQYPQW